MTGRTKIVRNFFISAFIMLASTYIIIILSASTFAHTNVFVECTVSSLLNFAVALGYFALIVWSFNRSNKVFLITLFGGMLVKMFVLAGMLIVFVLSFRSSHIWIISTFLIYYFLFQILEIIFFALYLKSAKELK